MADAKPRKNADLPVRIGSAVVMLGIAGTALWLGGGVWIALVAAIGLGVLWEWWGLVRRFVTGPAGRLAWLGAGAGYIGLAVAMLMQLRAQSAAGWPMLLVVLLGVILTDIGAYFAGRTIGGPRIAPAISPSKTWAGLGGGMLGAALGIYLAIRIAFTAPFLDAVNAALGPGHPTLVPAAATPSLIGCLAGGVLLATVAQAGDFFESWMKRRAGVKDSGHLIPGHGGLFDRTDGLIAVLFVIALLSLSGLPLGAG